MAAKRKMAKKPVAKKRASKPKAARATAKRHEEREVHYSDLRKVMLASVLKRLR